jgi:hypothetical protein
MLQGYNESRLKSSFRKFYGRYNDLVCDYKLSLTYMLNDLFHTLCQTVVSILAFTTGNPVYLISTKAHGGYDRSAEDAYSSMAPDPTFVFFGGPYYLHSILYLPLALCLDYDYVLHIVNFAILYYSHGLFTFIFR